MATGDSSANPSAVKPTFESNEAADKALKEISSMDTLVQLNLFETVIRLYNDDGLTQLELQKLQNNYIVELERKTLLLTDIIPGKGHFNGMQMLRRALKETEQHTILSVLDKAYKNAMDTLNTRLHDPELGYDQPHQKTSHDDSVAVAAATCSSDCLLSTSTELSLDANKDGVCRDGPTTARERCTFSGTITTSDDDNNDNGVYDAGDNGVYDAGDNGDASAIPIYVPEQQQQQQQSTIEINIQVHMPASYNSAFRQRSSHISFNTRPEGDKLGSICSVNEIECNSLTLKFVFVGDSSTGKTSLLYQYTTKKFSIAYEPTTLLDFHTAELECRKTNYKLHLWDTAGQERFKALTKAYYRGAVGAFVVYDVTDEKSLEHSLQWKDEVDDVVRLENDDPIPVVLIANKVDRGKLDGEQFSKDHGFTGYFETSAKTGQGIREAVRFMVKKVHELSYIYKEPVVPIYNRN